MEKKLKLCPLCGGSPSIKQTGKNELTLRCDSCHFGIRNKVMKYSLEWLEERLARNWNKRV